MLEEVIFIEKVNEKIACSNVTLWESLQNVSTFSNLTEHDCVARTLEGYGSLIVNNFAMTEKLHAISQ
jgi:hypothetical protein